jgi:hypothetical protein
MERREFGFQSEPIKDPFMSKFGTIVPWLISLIMVSWTSLQATLSKEEIERLKATVLKEHDYGQKPDQTLRDQWGREKDAAYAACRLAVAEGAYEVLEAAVMNSSINLRATALQLLEKIPREERGKILLTTLSKGYWPDPKD